MAKHKLTMKDVAQKAGVSITTVSHVINKTRHVNKETTDTVLGAIHALNYHSLKTKKSKRAYGPCVGVIIADIREDYYIHMMKAIETMAADIGVSIVFCDSEDDPLKEERNITILLDRKVNGLILAPIESEHTPKLLREIKIPIVLIDRQYESHNFFFVGINNARSSYLGTKYLIGKNCESIGFIGYSDSVYTIRQRIMGYSSCIMELRGFHVPKVLALNYSMEDSFPLIKKFIEEEQLDGLVCATSTICYEVINVIESQGSSLRHKVKIISFDDNRWLDFLKTPVSVISQPVAEIGNAALENITQMIEQPNFVNGVKKSFCLR
jgi:LacI family transcriptional regulator